jgi:hypothetical protein
MSVNGAILCWSGGKVGVEGVPCEPKPFYMHLLCR